MNVLPLPVTPSRTLKSCPLESGEQGYLADDPYFENTVRLGFSATANVAGASAKLWARVVAERVKATNEIRQLMYNRSYT